MKLFCSKNRHNQKLLFQKSLKLEMPNQRLALLLMLITQLTSFQVFASESEVNQQKLSTAQSASFYQCMAHLDRRVELLESSEPKIKFSTDVLSLNRTDELMKLQADQHHQPLPAEDQVNEAASNSVQRILIYVPKGDFEADGQTVLGIGVRLLDVLGKPIQEDVKVTIESTHARITVGDEDLVEPGVQLTIKNGEGCFGVVSPYEAAHAKFSVSVVKGQYRERQLVSSEGEIVFNSHVRPLLMVGIAEAGLSLKDIKSEDIRPVQNNDGFEDELRTFDRSFSNGKGSIHRRVAVFLKGKILGSALLTAAYDTDKNIHSKLFRDIDPNAFYPIYGDASIKGFDAQTSGRLYVKLEKARSYAQYGDITTKSSIDALELNQYSRSLLGGKGHLELNSDEGAGVTVEGFAAKDNLRQFIDEFRANGLSGPYTLSSSQGRIQSEKIEIITRDRNQPARVLKQVSMIRYTDYEFEPFSGRILFKRPIPSVDSELNPVYIRVTYEVEESTKTAWVGGGALELRPFSKSFGLGVSYIKDFNDSQVSGLGRLNELKGAFLRWQPTETGLSVVAEAARSRALLPTLQTSEGNAYRAKIDYDSSVLKARLYFGLSQQGFSNVGSSLSEGKRESRLELSYRLLDKTTLLADGFDSKDISSQAISRGASVSVKQDLSQKFSVELGARRSVQSNGAVTPQVGGIGSLTGLTQTTNLTGGTGPLFTGVGSGKEEDLLSVKARATAKVTERFGVFVEGEQDVRQSDKRELGLGLDYFVHDKTRIYAKYEILNSLSSVVSQSTNYQSRSAILGIDSEYLRDEHRDGQIYNEWRLRDAQSGREAQAVVGLRNGWNLNESTRLSTFAERLQEIIKVPSSDQSALGLGIGIDTIGSDIWKASAKIEGHQSKSDESLLLTTGWTRKLNRNWSGLLRDYGLYQHKRAGGTGHQLQNRFQLGVAYRQVDENYHHLLGMYEFKLEDNRGYTGSDEGRKVHIISAHENYQPSLPWIYHFHYAAKYVDENFYPIESRYFAHAAMVRVMWDFTDKFDLSPMASIFHSPIGSSIKYAAGAELGYNMSTNLWLSLGYNISGFSDRDLLLEEYTQQGVYLRLRFKFDEDTFGLGIQPRTDGSATIMTSERSSPLSISGGQQP